MTLPDDVLTAENPFPLRNHLATPLLDATGFASNASFFNIAFNSKSIRNLTNENRIVHQIGLWLEKLFREALTVLLNLKLEQNLLKDSW